MAGIPGSGMIWVAGAGYVLAKDAIKMNAVHAKINDRDPMQNTILRGLNTIFSPLDLQEYGTKNHIGSHIVFEKLVEKWCKEFNIKFNPTLNLYQYSYHKGYKNTTYKKDDESIRKALIAMGVKKKTADEVSKELIAERKEDKEREIISAVIALLVGFVLIWMIF